MKNVATINKEGILLSALCNKYIAIVESGKITENEKTALCSFINNKASKEEVKELLCLIADNRLMLTNEQNNKGIAFLRNQWKSPKGKERVTNPFGYREQMAVDSFTHFELIGLYDAGNYNRSFYIPLYLCVGSEGCFEYYYNGKVNIVG